MKRVLMISYIFPPFNGSGAQRPFYFAKHLPEFGYRPIVVTAEKCTISDVDTKPLSELLDCCKVVSIRELRPRDWILKARGGVKALDKFSSPVTKDERWLSHFAERAHEHVRGRLWSSSHRRRSWWTMYWVIPVVTFSLKTYFQTGFDLIWATGDPWIGLIAGYWISRLTHKPFVADIRDPWTYGVLWRPRDESEAEWLRRWEMRVLNAATRVVYTSPLTTEVMRGRTNQRIGRKMVTITNGFADSAWDQGQVSAAEKCVFRFVGRLMNHRKPDILLRGFELACKDPDFAKVARLEFVGDTSSFDSEIKRYSLDGRVACLGSVSQAESRQYMRNADALILLQIIDGLGNDVISGKVYEYLAARKPILGVVCEKGGDAWLMRTTSAGVITGIEDPNRVAQGFRHYWELWKDNKLATAVSDCDISRFSRRNLTQDLAELFEQILNHR